MITFGHAGDLHFSERFQVAGQFIVGDDGLNLRLTDVERCVGAVVDRWIERQSLFAVIPGDVFDHSKPTPNEERVAHRALDRAASRMPLFFIPGNHDYNGPMEAPGIISFHGRPNMHVALVPGYWDIELRADQTIERVHPFRPLTEEPITAGHGTIRIFALPWPSRVNLMAGEDESATKLTAEQLNAVVSQKLAGIVAGMRALRGSGANILMFHGTIREASVNEQPAALQGDIGLSVAEIDGFDYVALNHIHVRQEFDLPSGGRAGFSGGVDRFAHGEEQEEKGGSVVQLINGIPGVEGWRCEIELAPSPARHFKTHTVNDVMARGIDDDGETVHRVVGEVAPEDVGPLRARLAEKPIRFLKCDFEVTRQQKLREPLLKENWTTDALVRQRLEARSIGGDALAVRLDEHARIVAAIGVKSIQRLAGERPIEIELTNFGAYAHAVLDFESLGDSACIIGPNGAAKTTLIEAMLFAKTGECRVSQDDQIKWGEKELSVSYKFESGGHRYRITRTISRRTKRGSSLVTFSEWDGTGWVPKGDQGVAADEIMKATGWDYDVATSTSFCLDTGGGDLLRARAGDRIKIARKIFGGEECLPWKDSAEKKAARVLADVERLARDHAAAVTELAQCRELADRLPGAQAAVRVAAAAEEDAQTALAAARVEVERLRALEQQKAQHLAAVKSAEEEETAAIAQRGRVLTRIEQADRIASSIVEAKAGVESLKWARAEIETAHDEHCAATLARQEAEQAERDHQRKTQEALNRLHQAEREHAEVKAKVHAAGVKAVAEAKAKLDALSAKARAATQMETQREKARERELASKNGELTSHRQRMTVLQAVPCGGAGAYAACGLIRDAKASEAKVPEVEAAIAALREPVILDGDEWDDTPSSEDLWDAEKALKTAQEEHAAPVQLPGAAAVEEARAAIAGLQGGPNADRERAAATAAQTRYEGTLRDANALAGWPAALERAQQAESDVQALVAEREAAEDVVARAAARKQEARAALAAASGNDMGAAIDRGVAARAKVDEARQDLTRARVDMEIAERSATRFPELETAEHDAGAALATEQGKAQVFADLAAVYNEIPMLLIDSGGVAVQEVANTMLAAMGVPERVRIDTIGRNKSNANVKDTFDIWVTNRNGFEAVFDCYSKGERFGVDLALRRAFGEMQAARAAVNDPPPLVIDEGWGCLDTERRRTFPDVLRRVIESKVFSIVLTVSHVQEVIDTFRTLIVVNQGQDGSTIRIVRK